MKNRWLEVQQKDFRDFSFNLYHFRDKFLEMVPKTAKILDVGCGNGYFLRWLGEQGYLDTEGIDVIAKAVQETRDMGKKANMADIHCTDFRDNLFDAISLSHVLEHSPIPQVLLNEVVRITRPGGFIFIETPIQPDIGDDGGGGHFIFFSNKEEVDRLVSQAGMEMLFSKLGFDPYADHYVVVGKVKK